MIYFPRLLILRNNLAQKPTEIPNIKIFLHESWKNAICVDFDNDFSILNLFLTLKSYSDSLILIPIQIINSIFKINANKTIFTQSLHPFTLQNMNVFDFAIWLNERLNKDCVYVGDEIYIKRFVIIFSSFNFSIMYPKYPWNEESLDFVKKINNYDKENIIQTLLKEIKETKK